MASSCTPRRLVGKVGIVTASNQGIGYAIAERLGLEGASLLISSRKQKNINEALDKLKNLGIEAIGVPCHVSNREHRRNLIKLAVDSYGCIDFLISNAAVSPSVDPITEISESVLDKLWEVNVKAGILLVQDAAPCLQDCLLFLSLLLLVIYLKRTTPCMESQRRLF